MWTTTFQKLNAAKLLENVSQNTVTKKSPAQLIERFIMKNYGMTFYTLQENLATRYGRAKGDEVFMQIVECAKKTMDAEAPKKLAEKKAPRRK